MLNLPKFLLDKTFKSLLIIGCGGGWDFMGGIPIADSIPYHEGLPLLPKVTFANYSSHKNDFIVNLTDQYQDCHPESYIAEYVDKLYVIGRHGVQYVRQAINDIISKEKIDCILVVDGGVDALMHGDEVGAGTVLEDFIVLTAMNKIENIPKYFVSLGFGTETEEEVNHYRVLENISKLIQRDGYLGSCALTQHMKCFQKYKALQMLAISEGAKPSHIHTKIIAAVEGLFGQQKLKYDTRLSQNAENVFINPLMCIYWFFTLESVIANNLFITLLENTNTFLDAKIIFRQNIDLMNKRSREIISL